MTALNGPSVWGPLMETLTGVYGPRVILAGGAVRDFLVMGENYQPKDFDFFVDAADELDLEMSVPALTAVGLLYVNLMDYDKNAYNPAEGGAGNVVAVLEAHFDMDFEQSINIIGKRPEAITDPAELMSDFDHSLRQAWWTPCGGIETTDAFKKTLDTKVVQRYNADERTTKRLDRLLAKEGYGSFKMFKSLSEIVADKKEALAKRFKPADAKPWETTRAASVGDPILNFVPQQAAAAQAMDFNWLNEQFAAILDRNNVQRVDMPANERWGDFF